MLSVIRKRIIHRIFGTLTFLVLFLILMLYVIRVNETVRFAGKIQTKNVELVKSPCSTYIKNIWVANGEEVKKGQVLGTFDEDSIRTYIQSIQSNIQNAKARKINVEKERFNYVQNMMRLNVEKEDLLYKKNEELKAVKLEIANLENDIAKRKNSNPIEMKAMEENINSYQWKISNAESNYKKLQTLYGAGAIPQDELKKYELEIINLKAGLVEAERKKKAYEMENSLESIALLEANLQKSNEHLNNILGYKLNYDRELALRNKEIAKAEADTGDYEKQYAEELSLLDQEISGYNEQLKLIRTQLEDSAKTKGETPIVSPSNGMVLLKETESRSTSDNSIYNELSKVSPLTGKRLEKGELIAQIIDTESIYVECFIKEKDLPYIYEKDPVVITVQAYPYAKFGVLEGFVDKLYKMPVVSNGSTMYRCELKITNANRDIKTYLGFNTTNSVTTRRDISLLEYFLETAFKK